MNVNVKKVFKTVMRKANENLPGILTTFTVVGTWTSMIFGIKATPKAMQHIEEKKRELGKDKLTPIETIQACGKDYIPAVGSAVLATGTAIASTSISVNRTAAAASIAGVLREGLNNYQEKVVETLGENKAQKIQDEAVVKNARKVIDNSPIAKDAVSLTNADGKVICVDSFSGRAFWTNIQTVRKAETNIIKRIGNGWDNQATLNEFWAELDDPINLSQLPVGNNAGWGYSVGNFELHITHGWYKEGIPCMVLMYQVFDLYSCKPMT